MVTPRDFSGSKDMVRAFISVDIPAKARSALAEVASQLRQSGAWGVRWVRPEAIHLTLKFLGEIDTAQVDPIQESLGRAAAEVPPFALSLAGTGCFPNPASLRVIWVGLEGELDVLRRLQERVDEEVHSALGLPRESRRFTPHLILGRVRDDVSSEARRKVGVAVKENLSQKEVTLRRAANPRKRLH